MQKLVVLGSYMFAEEVADIVEDTGRYEIVAFIENWDRERCAKPLLGRPVVWIDDIAPYVSDCLAICSIGSTRRSGFIEQVASAGMRFATIQHPSARVSSKARLGSGCFVNAGVIVATSATVGNHVIVNRGACIGHHTTIGDYVTISPGAQIGGATVIGDGVYVGMGAIILERLQIGSDSIIGAGSVVTKDVPDHVLVMGVPARITREHVEGR